MDHFKSRLEWLFFRYQSGICTEEERIEFLELITKEENHEELNQLLKTAINEADVDQTLDPAKADQIYNAIVSNVNVENERPKKVNKTPLKRLLVAASVILLIGSGVFQWVLMNSGKTYRGSRIKPNPGAIRQHHLVLISSCRTDSII